MNRLLTPEESALLERAAGWPNCAWPDFTHEMIQQITRREGIEFATALLYDRLRSSAQHGPFIRAIDSISDTLEHTDRVTVVIVPGAFYREHPESGADGAFVLEQARRLGCKTALVPLESFGTIQRNVQSLCDWLRQQPAGPLILVSLSKAGAEVRLALADADAFRHVVAWVNLSGLVRGTPMVNWLFRHPARSLLIRLLFWWKGYAWTGVKELEWGPTGSLAGEFHVPADLLVVHLFGFPLAQHLSRPLAHRGHRRLTPLGPNDGGANLLTDLVSLPGLIYPVWGADHYLQPAWDIQALLRRVICYVVRNRL